MAKKEEKKQPETTEELIPEETAEAPQEAPKAAETPETNPFEEKYNAEHDSLLRLADGWSWLDVGAEDDFTAVADAAHDAACMVGVFDDFAVFDGEAIVVGGAI